MRRWGFNCFGCEPDPKSAKMASSAGLKIICSDLINARYPENRFDIIRFSHVLEHVHKPSEVLIEAKKILKPEGFIVIVVPNHKSAIISAFHHTEDVPRHLFSFSPATMSKYFEKVGLSIIKLTTETMPYDIYSQFLRFVGEELKSKPGPRIDDITIKRFWSHKNIRRQKEYNATAKFFDAAGLGRSIVIIGSKE